MALDSTTDAIRHFIGLFVLANEEGRLRPTIEGFERPEEAPGPDPSAAAPRAREPDAHGIEAYDPHLSVPAAAPDWVARELASAIPTGPDAPRSLPGYDAPAPLAPVPEAAAPAAQVFPAAPATPRLPEPAAPNAIATLTEQRTALDDDDVLLAGGDTPFVAPAAMAEALDTLAAIAEGAGAVEGVPTASSLDLDDVVALAAAFGTEEQAPQGQAVVDGVETDALPEWSDLMPAFLAADDDEDEQAPDGTEAVAADAGLAPHEEPFDVDPGHEVITGANQAINETAIATRWIDAPVIAVGGDVAHVDLVSQVNALVEDAPAPAPAGGASETAAAASRVSNAAQITSTSVPATPAEGHASDAAPFASVVTRYEGDLVAVNDTTQVNFLSDTDRVELRLEASNTYLGLGENLAVNSQSLIELGYQYDFIVVSGDMLVANVVQQTNVLLDLDSLGGPSGGGDAATTADNLLLNRAEIVREGVDTVVPLDTPFADTLARLGEGDATLPEGALGHELFEGVPVVRTLFVDGDFTLVNRVEQQNVVGDADQAGGAIAAFIEAFGSAARVTAGSNALVNAVALQDLGIDSTVLAGGESYSDALIHQAGLIEETGSENADPATLANEAVAFLADGLVEPGSESGAGPSFGRGVVEDGYGVSIDVMQTILS